LIHCVRATDAIDSNLVRSLRSHGLIRKPLPTTAHDLQETHRMKKPALVIGVAVGAISLAVGITGCGSDSKSTSSSTSPSTSTSTSTSTKTTTATTSAEASGPNPTIADYLKQNGIDTTVISHSTAGAPTIDLPVPDNWTKLPESDDAPYGGIQFNSPSNPSDPPQILAAFVKLSGNADPDKILAAAPGQTKNLQGFEGGDGQKDSLGGFPAYQIGGTYMKDGAKRLIAEKTVVIQGKDGLYVLQLRAQAPEADSTPLMDATSDIDQKTTITV